MWHIYTKYPYGMANIRVNGARLNIVFIHDHTSNV